MKLWHVTRKEAIESILKTGLDPRRATQKRDSVWFVSSRQKVAWALVHTMSKKRNSKLSLDHFVVVEVSIPRSEVRRYADRTWYTIPISEGGLDLVEVTPEMVHNAEEFGQ